MKIKEIIDLTYPIEEGMTTFGSPWHPMVEITQIGRHHFEGRATRKITFGSHTGTHMDAPLHFIENGNTIDNLPLDPLIGDVQILDFSHLKENKFITAQMLKEHELSRRIIFKFNWGKHWGTKKFYQDYPFFSASAANFLVQQKVAFVGMDIPSPDDSRIKLTGQTLGSEEDSPIHKIFLKHEVVIVEYLANLDLIKDYSNWHLIALPLRIKGSDGSPARVCIFR